MIKVYSGLTEEKNCRHQLHPINEVLKAEELVLSNKDIVTYSNSQDFIMAVKYIALKHKLEVEFFLDGVSCGDSIEPIFHECNKALDLINEKGQTTI